MLGTFDFNCSLFFSRSNKKEKETPPIFRLLDEPELPESFPHRCVLIQDCYKLVVSLWIPDNKDQSASILICWYFSSLLIENKISFRIGSFKPIHHPPWGDPCLFHLFAFFLFLCSSLVLTCRNVYFDSLSISYSIFDISK